MKFNRYLETLFGTRVKVKILRALWKYKGKEFTMRELAVHINFSHMGVRKAILDLEKTNVLKIKTIGKSHTVVLNEKSYAADIVEKMFLLEEETIGGLVKMSKKKLAIPEIESAALFGSVARGEETPLSDIDLFIITDNKEKAESAVTQLQHEIALRFGNTVSPYYLSKTEYLKKKNLPVMKQIIDKHITICGEMLQ